MARTVLRSLEHAWVVEVGQLGFRPPLPDEGLCGDDARFDVFLWRDLVECSVTAFADNPATAHDDWFTYMLVDPWGPHGGEALDATLAHEFNHACQSTDTWWESPWFFEASATYVESIVVPERTGWHAQVRDFQARPDWSLTRSDKYETWFMYGGALYLRFLGERYFDGQAEFLARVWHAARKSPTEGEDPQVDEPNFEHALDRVLRAEAGVSFSDSVLGFARWRWFTGARADKQHFVNGEQLAEVPVTQLEVPGRLVVDPAPMVLGSAYVLLKGEPGATVRVSLETREDAVLMAVQALAGGDELLDMTTGSAKLTLDQTGSRALVLTALPWPRNAGIAPDSRRDARHALTLIVE